MAIISCHECSKNLSDSATVCPSCGTKTKFALRIENANSTRKRIIFGVIGLLAAIFVGRIVYIEKRNQEFIDSGAAAAMQDAIKASRELSEQIEKGQKR